MNVLSEQSSSKFFDIIIDVALIIVTVLSSLISLCIPCLYFVKRQCRQHPTVLIANISLIQSVANFNVLLMAYGMYLFERMVSVQNIFHLLSFGINFLPSSDDFCTYNYCIYMFLQLLSMSFHICYSIDLLITLKFPFVSGRKRRKYYFIFSALLPVIAILNSIKEAQYICQKDLIRQSIYVVPWWFLLILMSFCGLSLLIIVFSFIQPKNKTAVRQAYIHQHRTILLLLVLLWICPIWVNLLQIYKLEDSSQFMIINLLAFFSIVISSGVINMVRIFYDKGLRQKIGEMLRLKPHRDSQQIQQSKRNKNQEQVWNLPLAGAITQFQSQQIVHNILQVVCQACSDLHQKNGRESIFRNSHQQFYESIYRSTILIQSDTEILSDTSKTVNPNDFNLSQLKQLCKKKRTFKMTCITQSKHQNVDDRLREKTVTVLSNKDYQKANFENISNLEIIVTSYSHRLFKQLRNNDGIGNDQIQDTLNLEKNINSIKKAKESLGASGSFFFFSYDHKLVIKTISEQEKDRFIQILPYYFDHIREFPTSLFARTYGIFSIEIEGISKIYFIMMENTFHQLESNCLHYRIYDLKGSTVQREVKDSQATVFKDVNYFQSSDCFIFMTAENKAMLIDQIDSDITMLKNHNIMDYSLLLGVSKSKISNHARDKDKSIRRQEHIQNWRYVNALQEATNKVYSISIIDYLQEFNFNKKMQLWFKRLFKGGGDISSIDTKFYYERFLKFIKRITLTFKVKAHGHYH